MQRGNDDDEEESYEVACKDLKSLIKWNIKDLSGICFTYHITFDHWENLVREVKELGRRPTYHDGMKLVIVDWLMNRVFKFPQLCRDLENNDPNTTTVVILTNESPSGCAGPLGTALNGNTHVSTLNLELPGLFPHNSGEQEPLMVQYLKPLLHYIESGPALRKLELKVDEDRWKVKRPEQLVDTFLRSAAKSKNLYDLDIDSLDMAKHITAICSLLKQTTSLRSLNVTMGTIVGSPEYAYDCEQVASALGTNRTLETLILAPSFVDSGFVDLVLSHLSGNPCLKDFVLRRNLTVANRGCLRLSRLSAMLKSSTSQLRSLYLGGCFFNSDGMKEFVLGLKTNRTLETLVLTGCHLDEDAKAAFLRFFQSTDIECQLRELGFRGYWRSEPHKGTILDTAAASEMAIQLLLRSPIEGSFGSLLERLTFDFPDPTVFLKAYANNASMIRLPYVHLGFVTESGWQILEQCLRNILYLRELSIDRCEDGVSASTLTRVLRRNGSVQVVHMTVTRGTHDLFGVPLVGLTFQTSMEKRRYESILLRNQHVPMLLTSPRLCPSGVSDGGADRDVDDENTGMGTSSTMVPPLFQVMAPAERMQPNTVLMGLLAFKNNFGTSTALAAKRSLPADFTSATTSAPLKLSRNSKTTASGNTFA